MKTHRSTRQRYSNEKAPVVVFEPRRASLLAAACLSLWIVLLSLPMLTGAFLASPYNDQYSSGYAYRAWAAEWWKKLGHLPLWNPELLGGLPFVGATHGDVLYPTAWIRLVVPTHVAMNLGFVIHYFLAGMFMYWFLRRWGTSWTAGVVGGLAYQLSGVVGSYVSPGHDGKLFVTSLLPLLLTGLTIGVRGRKPEGYALGALAVGLIMLSPHPQMAEYALLAAGIFTLFLVFGEPMPGRARLAALGLALAAVVIGVGVSAAQYLPFYAYVPYSPRATTVLNDFAWSAAYAIPWAHVPEFIIPRFAGETFSQSYWGPNGLKLHSEYFGIVVVALAAVGVADARHRKMTAWLVAIAVLFLLIALGQATPFYRLWWAFVPFAKSTRAPGMAVFVVSFVMATLAAFGLDRVLTGHFTSFGKVSLIAGTAVVILALLGVFGAMTESLGRSVELNLGLPNRAAYGSAAAQTVRWSALLAGLALAAAGLVARLRAKSKISSLLAASLFVGIVGTDLWLNARPFWMYSRAPDELFGGDAITARLRSIPRPFRVWDIEVPSSGIPSVYPGAALMASDIPQLYGHHGNEPRSFDLLNGRTGQSLTYDRAGNPRILELFAVNYLILQAAVAPESIPGFRRTLSKVATSSGVTADLYERSTPAPYARFLSSAATAPAEKAVDMVLNESFPIGRTVVIDTAFDGSPDGSSTLAPPPSDVPVAISDWVPGRMHLTLARPAPGPGYVLVSENWDRAWRARIDGHAGRVQRGDITLIAVPVAAGAREIELEFDSPEFRRGRNISFAALGVIALGMVPAFARRRRRKSEDTAIVHE